jgi:hypothetical protein
MAAQGQVWSGSRSETADELNSSRVELQDLVIEFQKALKEHQEALKTALETNQPPINAGREAVVALDNIRKEIVENLQNAENGTHSPIVPQTATHLATLRSAALTSLDKSSQAAMALQNSGVVCTGSLEALDAVLRLTINGTPIDPDKALDVQNSLRAVFRELRPSTVEDDCPAQGKDGPKTKRLHDAILALADWLRDPTHRAAVADDFSYELLADAREAGTIYVETSAKRTAVLAAAKKVEDDRAATLKLAEQLQRFGTLYASQMIDDSKCWMTAGVVEVDRIRKTGFDLPWFQVQTEEYAMTVRPMFKDDIVRTLPDTVKGKYSFSRGNFGIGVDTALIYSPANDREYKAATRPFDANNDGTVAAGETAIFATETSRTDRTGKLALMLSVSPKWAHGFGAQLGFGADTDNPAGFIGLTRSLGRFARLSAGHTQQRVTRLGTDMTVGQKLVSADDLRTRERFDASWYAALAFTLSELPIFKTK